MRKIFKGCLAAAVAAVMLASCQSAGGILTPPAGSATPSSTAQQGGQDLLGSLLGGLLGQVMPISAQSLAGTWTYSAPDCRFESENALAQAGGAVAAASVNAKLAEYYSKVGIKPGSCSFTFGEDNSCSITLGSRTISGRYTIDTKTRDLNITSSTGLIKINGKAYFNGRDLTILFDANKLLSIAQTLSAFTGQGSGTLSAISSVLGQYKGMLVGMTLVK